MPNWLLSWQAEKAKTKSKDMENNHKMDSNVTQLWHSSRLRITDKFEYPPVILKINDSIIGTLGNFSASTGKAKSKKTFNITAIVASALINDLVLNYKSSFPEGKSKILYIDTEQSPFHCQLVLNRIVELAEISNKIHPENLEFLSLRRFTPETRIAIIEEAIRNTEGLGLVVIDGVRDLAYDINSPSEATNLITKFMQWTDHYKLHIHTVLHLNKTDDNTRGHLGTELNNKAETILKVTKDEHDTNTSYVSASNIRDIEFEPFAFTINETSLPVLVENYRPTKSDRKSFDYLEVSQEKHKEALESLFLELKTLKYKELINGLREKYASIGYVFGENKAKDLKTFLENKRMIIKEGTTYKYNPNFHY